jgi:hypothetical protein
MLNNRLYPWQKDLLNKLNGLKPGEMTIVISGRRTGKSVYNQYMQYLQAEPYKIVSTAEVDGSLWRTVKCNKPVCAWIRSQEQKDVWFEHIDTNWYVHGSMFDISEELYMMLVLKFGKQ